MLTTQSHDLIARERGGMQVSLKDSMGHDLNVLLRFGNDGCGERLEFSSIIILRKYGIESQLVLHASLQ